MNRTKAIVNQTMNRHAKKKPKPSTPPVALSLQVHFSRVRYLRGVYMRHKNVRYAA